MKDNSRERKRVREIYCFYCFMKKFFFPFSRTPDEDFGILLEAAVMYDRRVAAILNESDATEDDQFWVDFHDGKEFLYPRILFIITGN